MGAYSKQRIKTAITPAIRSIYKAEKEFDAQSLYSNTLDCFSATLDSLVQDISISEWLEQESLRQRQKTKQNAVGSMHEDIIGSFDGIHALEVGKIFDIHFPSQRIIAEVKNKHNTTKGNHKVQIYKDLEHALATLTDYTGYYVEILPKNGKRYNNPFTPSNNLTQRRLPERADIRIIDGKSFYSLITGEPDAMDKIYKMLPEIVEEILHENFKYKINKEKVLNDQLFGEVYNKIYPNSI